MGLGEAVLLGVLSCSVACTVEAGEADIETRWVILGFGQPLSRLTVMLVQ